MGVKGMASKGQKFKKRGFEEKLRIVKLHIEDHVSIRQLSKQEGTTDGMVGRWVQEYDEAGEEGLRGKKRSGNPSTTKAHCTNGHCCSIPSITRSSHTAFLATEIPCPIIIALTL